MALLTLESGGTRSLLEVSVQGTGFFTKDGNGDGIKNQATETRGLLIGYRYSITRWLVAKPTTAMTATRSATSVAHQAVCSRTFTRSPAQQL